MAGTSENTGTFPVDYSPANEMGPWENPEKVAYSGDWFYLYILFSNMAAKLGRLAANNTAFLLCDIQEKFRPSIRYFPEIIKVAQRMVRYSKC